MKKKLINLLLVMSSLMTFSCNNDYIEPNQFSDIAFINSDFQNNTFVVMDGDTVDALFIGVNDFISFSDLSQNTVEHKWTIPSNAKFLDGNISRNDDDYTDFIMDTEDSTSSEKSIHVYFEEGSKDGLYEINLRNTFNDSVSFKGVDTVASVFEDGFWVFDTTFMVKVFDTIQVAVEVKQMNVDTNMMELIDLENTDTIYVEAGDVLEFSDVSVIGEPDTRTWTIAGDKYSAQTIMPTFKKLGLASVTLSVSRSGENIPPDSEFYKFPVPIKVIPSSKPFLQQGLVQQTQEKTILIPFNGEFTNLASGAKDLFTVTINGNSANVSDVSLSATDKTIIELTLSDETFSDDVIVVSYSGGLESTDSRQSEAFDGLTVNMYDPNILPKMIYGFEESQDTYWEAHPDNFGELDFKSTEQAASGTYSMKMVSTSSDWTHAQSNPLTAAVTVEAGKTYIFSYKVYVEPGSSLPFVAPWIAKPSGNKQFWQSIASFTPGEWTTIEKEWTANADEAIYITLRIKNEGTIYVDDFSLIAKENFRPTE